MSENLSTKWIIAYYQALAKAWENPEFKHQLLSKPSETLKEHFNFTLPEHLEVQFKDVDGEDFSQFPAFPLSVFDAPSNERRILKIPLVPAPEKMESEIAYLNSFTQGETIFCCCLCF